MAEAILSGAGRTDGRWYREEELERQVLGFANTAALARPADHATLIAGMKDIYKTWAKKRLPGDEDNITGFCSFLASPVGGPVRLDGLMWIAAAVRANPDVMRGRHDYLSSAMVEFLDTLITEHAAAIANSVEHRQAHLTLVAAAVSRQFPNALALQDRVKKLL
jgi:hypothetical protein